MPTKAELVALKNTSNTDATWLDATEASKQYASGCTLTGRKYVGKGGYSSISVFFPAAGYSSSGSVSIKGSGGRYWSSAPYSDSDAWYLGFGSSNQYVDSNERYLGYSVRAVLR